MRGCNMQYAWLCVKNCAREENPSEKKGPARQALVRICAGFYYPVIELPKKQAKNYPAVAPPPPWTQPSTTRHQGASDYICISPLKYYCIISYYHVRYDALYAYYACIYAHTYSYVPIVSPGSLKYGFFSQFG